MDDKFYFIYSINGLWNNKACHVVLVVAVSLFSIFSKDMLTRTVLSSLLIIGCISALQSLQPQRCFSTSTCSHLLISERNCNKGSYFTLSSKNGDDAVNEKLKSFEDSKIINKPSKSKIPIQKKDSSTTILNYFVPGFVLFWAVSYSALGYYEISSPSGFGDMGGAIGVALIGLLFISLIGALVYEVFMSDE